MRGAPLAQDRSHQLAVAEVLRAVDQEDRSKAQHRGHRLATVEDACQLGHTREHRLDGAGSLTNITFAVWPGPPKPGRRAVNGSP
ncbi:MAG: hypothetical protein E6G07_06995 [Actinobacteria bacterium]|nr:MAG: hypothetical protein E6G07_06995 [Actinomycetota bacterium]